MKNELKCDSRCRGIGVRVTVLNEKTKSLLFYVRFKFLIRCLDGILIFFEMLDDMRVFRGKPMFFEKA